MKPVFRKGKRVIVLITGFTVLSVGVLMIALPGPAFIVIPLGLAILGTELPWAKRVLNGIQSRLRPSDAGRHHRR